MSKYCITVLLEQKERLVCILVDDRLSEGRNRVNIDKSNRISEYDQLLDSMGVAAGTTEIFSWGGMCPHPENSKNSKQPRDSDMLSSYLDIFRRTSIAQQPGEWAEKLWNDGSFLLCVMSI